MMMPVMLLLADVLRIVVLGIIWVRVRFESAVDEHRWSVSMDKVGDDLPSPLARATSEFLYIGIVLGANISYERSSPWMYELRVVFVQHFSMYERRILVLLAEAALEDEQLD